MEINLVVLSVGNSRVAVAPFRAGELGKVVRVSNREPERWVDAIAEAWRKIDGTENAAVVAAGTNPKLNDAVEQAVMRAANRHVVWVGRDLELPVKVLTDNPEQTGVDRVLNVAAAYEQIGKACVVVDAGTAVTVSVCNDQGQFLGGAIAPGVQMQLDALHEKIPHLPRVRFGEPDDVFGRNTDDAIRNAVYHGVRGMVKELVENYATELGSWPEMIATGGDAEALFEGWELVHAIAPDLMLYGIAMAYANHHIAHET